MENAGLAPDRFPHGLTDTTIRNAPSEKLIRMFDGGDLYLEVAPLGPSGGGSSTGWCRSTANGLILDSPGLQWIGRHKAWLL